MYGTAFEHSVLYDYQFNAASNVYAGHIQHETAYFQANPNALTPFTPNAAYADPTFSHCTAQNCPKTWGLRVLNSTNIFIYAAGLYSFFENWSTTSCLVSESCQEHMVDVQNSTDVYLWALSTKGSSYLVSYENNDVVPYAVNKAAFCDTIALFEVSPNP
jgi:glucan 1,3-beta-glucosidase